MRDGQTSPHKPRLVVSHSTCPHFPPSPTRTAYNRYTAGTAVINKSSAASRVLKYMMGEGFWMCPEGPGLRGGPHAELVAPRRAWPGDLENNTVTPRASFRDYRVGPGRAQNRNVVNICSPVILLWHYLPCSEWIPAFFLPEIRVFLLFLYDKSGPGPTKETNIKTACAKGRPTRPESPKSNGVFEVFLGSPGNF